jgi:hypothetical protein
MSYHYEKIGQISIALRKKIMVIARSVNYQVSKGEGTDYEASFDGRPALEKLSELTDLWPVDIWQSAFFLKLPPAGFIHRHIDQPHPWNTYHIVLQTNSKAISSMYDEDGAEHPFQLKTRMIYRVDRSCEHGSVNNGGAERFHLLMEIRDA